GRHGHAITTRSHQNPLGVRPALQSRNENFVGGGFFFYLPLLILRALCGEHYIAVLGHHVAGAFAVCFFHQCGDVDWALDRGRNYSLASPGDSTCALPESNASVLSEDRQTAQRRQEN